jgi:hypothetical protein
VSRTDPTDNRANHPWQLVIDAQGVQGPFNERGIARTVTAVSEALVSAGLPVTAVLLNPHHALPPLWHATLRQLPLRWSTASATRDLIDGPPIVWLMLSPMEGSVPDEAIVPTLALSGRTAIVPLVHDAIPMRACISIAFPCFANRPIPLPCRDIAPQSGDNSLHPWHR